MFTSQDVMALRQKTGAGMMDCKKALTATNGDMDKAVDFLREKGIASAAKRESKIASQGIVDSYIHMNGRIGVLVEVNCETDFVARSQGFKDFVHNVAMQIAAANPLVVNPSELPQEAIEKEKEIYRAQALDEPKPKPMNIIEKMVEGRVQKYFKEVCLMEQVYVKDSSKTIKQLLQEQIAAIGEKINIRRFVRFEMGEGLEKKVDNFAEEVMSQVGEMNK